MESILITLVVIALAAISNWLQNRAQSQENDPHRPTPPTAPPQRGPNQPQPRTMPRPSAESLERQLRRLLGEEPPPAAPAPRRHDIPHTQVPPAPPPIQPPRIPPLVQPPEPSRPRQIRPEPIRVQLPKPEPRVERTTDLHESVTLRLKMVDEQMARHRREPALPGPKPLPLSAHSSLGSLLQDRQAVRQAFVASLIFGPAKALEDREP